MKLTHSLRLLAAVLALSALSMATTLKGTVKNGTTGKPAAGDDVVLLELSQGMQEAGRTKTDAHGNFIFTYNEGGGPHMVRVLHQGVNYFSQGGIIPPGTSSTEVTVYDAAAHVQGIGLTVDMVRVQAEGSTLELTELWAVKNNSDPPRTQMSDQAFEIYLPQGAQVDSGMASGPGGQPVQSAPVPQGQNKYAFTFPVRPGETRFQVSYHLSYNGKAKLQPKLLYPADHVVVMLPKTMQFSSGGAGFQTMTGGDPNANIQVITNVNAGQDLTFNVSGTGTVGEVQETARGGGAPGGSMGGGGAAQRGRPGGGLGTPEETPDPLHRYRGYILGGLAVALALGVFYVVTRPQPAASASAAVPQQPAPVSEKRERIAVSPPARVALTPAESRGSDRLLDALKEELFQLELERHQGKISDEEYTQAKAALDTTLARAAKRATP